MESQHMTQQVFAQFIEMSPAILSSIFNGRTKPTLNIVEAIKKKIPNISVDWLLFGSGSMFLDTSTSESVSAPVHQPVQESMFDFSDSLSPTPEFVTTGNENRSQAIVTSNSVKNTHTNSPIVEIKNTDKPPRRVTEIRVFYDDQTWESFVPAKK